MSPSNYYHVYNRANGWENIFAVPENYRYFLQQYRLYLDSYVDTYCYCLMPNHFHFLVKIKEEKYFPLAQNLQGLASLSQGADLAGLPNSSHMPPEKIISHQFSKFFNSYTKAFNKQQGRRGNLFMKSYKRKQITDDLYFKKLVHYIHHNPVDALLCDKPENWEYSSYNDILKNNNTFIKKNELVGWFSNLDDFINFHRLSPDLKAIEE